MAKLPLKTPIRILSVSDMELGFIYSPQIVDRFGNVDLMISCGDLPYYYLEYMISMLNRPMYYVRGNHAGPEYGVGGTRTEPWGATNLHRRVLRTETGLLLAGLEGCLRYNYGPYQYTQAEMWTMVWGLVPRLFYNRQRYGRYLDIFVSHASPWGIHDTDDRPHVGIKAFRWLIEVFRPALHLHGHIHIYRQDTTMVTQECATQVVNTFGYRQLTLDVNPRGVEILGLR